MKFILRSIPNFFTALNFFCGCFAVYLAYKNLFEAAFLMVFLGAFFDLFDGFFARLLKVESQFGLQFDSMADLITSGLAPAMVMYKLFLEVGVREIDFSFRLLRNEFHFTIAPFALVGFIIALGAAIRLAKFNIDSEQREEFKGMPAPANALFIVALPLLFEHPLFVTIKPFFANYTALFIISLVSVLLMNIRLPLFSFKITSFNLKQYGYQFVFLLLVFPVFYFFRWVAVPIMILFYLLLNVIRNSLS